MPAKRKATSKGKAPAVSKKKKSADDDDAFGGGDFFLDDDDKKKGVHSDSEDAGDEVEETAEEKRLRLGKLQSLAACGLCHA